MFPHRLRRRGPAPFPTGLGVEAIAEPAPHKARVPSPPKSGLPDLGVSVRISGRPEIRRERDRVRDQVRPDEAHSDPAAMARSIGTRPVPHPDPLPHGRGGMARLSRPETPSLQTVTIPSVTALALGLRVRAPEQEHPLRAEQVPDPPRHREPHRPAVGVERRARARSRRRNHAPARRNQRSCRGGCWAYRTSRNRASRFSACVRAQAAQAHAPMPEIRQRDDGVPADAQQMRQHRAGCASPESSGLRIATSKTCEGYSQGRYRRRPG